MYNFLSVVQVNFSPLISLAVCVPMTILVVFRIYFPLAFLALLPPLLGVADISLGALVPMDLLVISFKYSRAFLAAL